MALNHPTVPRPARLGRLALGCRARGAFRFSWGWTDPPERLWPILLRIQLLGLSPPLRRCIQDNPVHSGGAFTSIAAYPFDGQELGCPRACEQALQTPYAVPVACFERLHDAGLQSADVTLDGIPVETGPRVCHALRAFNDTKGAHRPRYRAGFALARRCRDSRPAGSQPPFEVGLCANPCPRHYSAAFACSGLPYPLDHHPTLAGWLPPSVRGRSGLPRFAPVPLLKGLGPAFAPTVLHLRGENTELPGLTAHLFGSCLSASLAWYPSRRLNSGSPALAIPQNPSSRPP